MVVIQRAHGFRFVIYTSDHEPAHVHITGAGHAKVNLVGAGGRPELMTVTGITRGDMRRLMMEVESRRDAFIREWERIHGSSD